MFCVSFVDLVDFWWLDRERPDQPRWITFHGLFCTTHESSLLSSSPLVYVCVYRPKSASGVALTVLFLRSHSPWLETESLTGIWGSAIRQGWLASEATCLHIASAGITWVPADGIQALMLACQVVFPNVIDFFFCCCWRLKTFGFLSTLMIPNIPLNEKGEAIASRLKRGRV